MPSCAILDTTTPELEFYTSGDRQITRASPQVTALTLSTGGRWMAHTLGSRYLFDLARVMVERLPGPGAVPTSSDRILEIRSID